MEKATASSSHKISVVRTQISKGHSRRFLDELPLEIILKVFSYFTVFDLLRRVAVVCKKWHDITQHSQLWRSLRLSEQRKLDDAALVRLSSLSSCVVHLDISYCGRVSDEGFFVVIQNCRFLESLNISKRGRGKSFKKSALEAIGNYSVQLQNLSLSGQYTTTDDVLLSIGQGCKQLRVLDLEGCGGITDKGLKGLVDGCPLLISLILKSCKQVTKDGVKHLIDRLPGISHLDLCSVYRLSDEVVREISKLSALKKLAICGDYISMPTIIHIMTSCPLLQSLTLAWIRCVNNQNLNIMGEHFTNLQELSIQGCYVTDEGVSSLAEYCKRLTYFALIGECPGLETLGALEQLLLSSPLMKKCKIRFCDWIKKTAINELILKFPSMKFDYDYEDYGEEITWGY